MKVVIDTNVEVPAYFWGGNPKKLLDEVFEGTIDLYMSKDILEEITGVLLRPKFRLAPEIVHVLAREVEEISILVRPKTKLLGVSRDPKDHIIME